MLRGPKCQATKAHKPLPPDLDVSLCTQKHGLKQSAKHIIHRSANQSPGAESSNGGNNGELSRQGSNASAGSSCPVMPDMITTVPQKAQMATDDFRSQINRKRIVRKRIVSYPSKFDFDTGSQVYLMYGGTCVLGLRRDVRADEDSRCITKTRRDCFYGDFFLVDTLNKDNHISSSFFLIPLSCLHKEPGFFLKFWKRFFLVRFLIL